MNSNSHRADSSILVRKYGGSSLETVDRIKEIARDIAQTQRQGFQMVVVVSAMGKTTNELADLAAQAAATPPRRELDMLLSVGERITMSLLSMALAEEGCSAISLTGSQCGIITDTSHTDARIIEVKGDRVRQALAQGHTVVVAGFQGVSREKEITTLGRGGSDTTAVALAAALGAVRCEILKDVDGVMSTDPSVLPQAVKHDHLSSTEMTEIADTGCGVVHVRAVEYAAEHGVQLVVRSSFNNEPGTTITPDIKESQQIQTASLDQPSCNRASRYRPLVMSINPGVLALRIATDSPQLGCRWRDLILDQLDPTCVVAEWMDSGQSFRWEILAPADHLHPIHEALLTDLDNEPGTVASEEDLTCISFSGGRPDSWLEVQRHLSELLEELGTVNWRLRADGSALRVILSGEIPHGLPEHLHKALLPR